MNSDLQSWDKAAAGWDQSIAHEGSYRTLLIEDALNNTGINYSGLNVLDAGSGNGYFSDWLVKKGATVVGLEGSQGMVNIAKQKYPSIVFETHDLLQPTDKPENSYDLILANMLLMHLSNISTFLNDAKKLLKPKGSLIFSILHPCFNYPTAKLHKTIWEKITLKKPNLKVFDYYLDKTGRYESHFQTELTHYHRTLEEYSIQLQIAGFVVNKLIEPHHLPKEFLKQNPKFEYAQRLPRFLFFICQPI
jgi:2-polyprenyl-3-methyl-5-hydroxy-6-metoxy-1,4-benzoquinol methylase